MEARYFFGIVVSFTTGVVLESILNLGYSFSFFLAAVSLSVFLVARKGSHSKNVLLVSLVLLGCSAGVSRVDVSQARNGARELVSYTEKTIKVIGVIVEEPDVREEYTNIVLDAGIVLYDNVQNKVEKDTRILVRVPPFPQLQYGDRIEAAGKLLIPKNFQSEGSPRAFDYRSYLAKDNIFYQMYLPKVEVLERDSGNIVQEKLFKLKGWLVQNIAEQIPEPEASLASGITLGAKQSLGSELLQKFRETGVAHIVVLSGYNIAVVSGIVTRLVIFFPFAIRAVVSVVTVLLFAIMVGGGATVVRAATMALVVLLARVFGRDSDALRALVLAGGIMVFINPMIILHDVSFQLSFSATLAIVVLAPILEKYFTRISNNMLREIVVTTFATQIFVLPLILYHMGSVSLIGFISNVFILPVVPLAMLMVAILSVVSWVPIVSTIASFFTYAILAYVIHAVDFFARAPFASLHGISFSLSALIIFYALLAIFIIKNFSTKTVSQKNPNFNSRSHE